MNLRTPNEDLFDNSRMSFGDHLEELRKVLFKCLISTAIGCVFGFMLANPIVKMLTKPLVGAMEEYIKSDSMASLVERKGYIDPELYPWLQEDKFVPRQTYVDPVELVNALQAVVPDFATQIKIDPYGFRAENFNQNKIQELCQGLVRAGANQAISAENLAERQRQKIWSLLNPAEQAFVTGIATATADIKPAVAKVVEVFNRVATECRLFEFPEFMMLIEPTETTWLDAFLASTPQENPLANMNQRFQKEQELTVAKRLNRALLAGLFADQLRELKAELVPLDVWEPVEFQPQALGVTETFMVWLKAGLLAGFTFAAPFIFYHLWTFVAAGLYPHEQKYVYIYLPMSIFLFLSGVFLVFLFVFQPVLQFLFSFNRQMGISPQMRINDWLSFVMLLPVGFGIAFQLPLVMLFMNRIGLFQVNDYLQKWRVAVMSIFVLSMFLTPQDPISLLLLAIPLCFLYFLGVGMCVWMPKHTNPFREPDNKYIDA